MGNVNNYIVVGNHLLVVCNNTKIVIQNQCNFILALCWQACKSFMMWILGDPMQASRLSLPYWMFWKDLSIVVILWSKVEG